MSRISEPILRLPALVRQDVAGYRAQLEKFQRGEITPVAFRAVRVPMGVYEHRQEGRFMVRVRLGAGMVLPSQLQLIAELSRTYGNGVLHFTTRQDVQIHDVSIEDTAAIHEKLLEAGLSARGGGGNTVRNVTSCPRALVCAKVVFDVAPFAIAAAEYLLQSKSSFNLPRKFKISFSGCATDCAFASVNDVGFFPHRKDGRKGFAVYAGGSLGPHPAIGVLIEDFIAAEAQEVCEVLEAVKRLFDRLGDRSNKHAARLRYVLLRLGAEAFVAEYRKEREAVRREGLSGSVPPIRDLAASCLPGYAEGLNGLNGDSAQFTPGALNRQEAATENWALSPFNPGVLPERQPGRFTLQVRLHHGMIPAPDLVKVGEIAERFGLGLVLATQQQDLLIPAVPGRRVTEAREELKKLSLGDSVLADSPKIVACAGASTCKLGLCNSPRLADAIAARLREAGVGSGRGPAAIRISGCPNSCGNHHIAAFGLEGKVKRHQGRLIPCYEVLAGGNCAEGQTTLATRLGTVPAKAIPDLVAEIYQRGASSVESLRELVAPRTAIPDQLPEDCFFDHGASAPFTLAGRGPGECGAGVLDIIRVDIEESFDALRAAGEPSRASQQAVHSLTFAARTEPAVARTEPGAAGDPSRAREQADKSAAVYRSVAAAARALLPVFGLEAKKDREIFEAFGERLVAPGWVKPESRELAAAAMDWRLGDRPSLEDLAGAAKELADRVRELFLSLDANLHFRAAPVLPSPSGRGQGEGLACAVPAVSPSTCGRGQGEGLAAAVPPVPVSAPGPLDLRGVTCPMNFIKAKIALERLPVGETLDVLLDDGEPARNVPATFTRQGQEVLAAAPEAGLFHLRVKRRK